MENTGLTREGYRPSSAQGSVAARENASGTTSKGLDVKVRDKSTQSLLPRGDNLELAPSERDISLAESAANTAHTRISPLAISEPDNSLEGRCLLERFILNSTPFNQKVIKVFVGCLNTNEILALGKKLNLSPLALKVLTPESEQEKKLGDIGARTLRRGQQSDVQHAVATTFIHMCQNSPKKSLEIIDAVVEDKPKTYGVFTQGVAKSPDCQGIRDYCALPERDNLSVLPYSIVQTYTPLRITCHVGKKGASRPVTAVQAMAIAKELTGVEYAQRPLLTDFKKQMSSPAGGVSVNHFSCVYVSLEKPSASNHSIVKTDVLYGCNADDLFHELDSVVGHHFDDSSQTKTVCQHFIQQRNIQRLLEKLTSQMPLQKDTTANDPEDYCLVRIISLNKDRMVVIVNQRFGRFAKDGGFGYSIRDKNSEGQLYCDVTLLRIDNIWRVQGCNIGYKDSVNSVERVYQSESELWEQRLSVQIGPSGAVKKVKPVEAECMRNDTWLVSDDLPKAIRLREMDISLYLPMTLWEEKIEKAEEYVASGSLSLEAMQKLGSLYKTADVDADCDLKRLCRQSSNESPEEIRLALNYSLSNIHLKREELTRRAEAVGKAVFSLKQDFPPIDPSLFEQDIETQQKLQRLTELYKNSTDWHKGKLSYLIHMAQVDLKEKTENELSLLFEEVKELESLSKNLLASYRAGDSEGGQITKYLEVKDTSDPRQKARSENLAPHTSLSYTYSAIFVWYRKKVQHQIEQEMKRRGMISDAP